MALTLLRVKQTDSDGRFLILNLQTITRVDCKNFDQGQDEHRATVSFPDGGRVILAGADADRVVSALEDFLGYPH